jgi:hypothetical protein
VSPTGYFNPRAALFTSAALVSASLAVRTELPALLRGLLIAIPCDGIQLTLLAESRGWLFTLPLMLALRIAITKRDSVRRRRSFRLQPPRSLSERCSTCSARTAESTRPHHAHGFGTARRTDRLAICALRS